MQWKNRTSDLIILVAIILITVVLAGCGVSAEAFIEKEVNSKIDVLGVKLDMAESKVHESIGAKGEKAMCIYGYEYGYEDKLINIGFNSETGRVRRITTKNPETSIYGIKPGTELEQANKTIDLNGFKKDDSSKYRFYKENIILSIISMKGTHANGITIEINPDHK